jgi:RNA recognition motif-containing protein
VPIKRLKKVLKRLFLWVIALSLMDWRVRNVPLFLAYFIYMNIYVGNLNYNMTEDDLKEVFSAHGAVDSAKIITDKFTGRARGFGFVEMPNDSEGNAAIEALNGSDIQGRSLTVNVARPREEG